MSSWSEAAWVISELQKNFDFSSDITYYTQNLNTLNTRVINLNNQVDNLEDILAETQDDLINRASSFIAKKTNGGQPDSTNLPNLTYSKGTIWFVQK